MIETDIDKHISNNLSTFEKNNISTLRGPYKPALTYEDIDIYYCRGQGRVLSELTGLCRSHVTQVLRKKIGMSLDSAKKLADVAGISIERFQQYLDQRNG